MPEPMLCPSCQRPLRVPKEFQLAWLTCPHCQAFVPTPASEPDPNPRPPIRPRTASGSEGNSGRPQPPAAPGTCPNCGKSAEAEWLFCPHCEEPLRPPGGPSIAHRRWFNLEHAGNSGWVVLGSFGLLFALVASAGVLVQGSPLPLLILVAGVVILLGISTLITLVRTDGALTQRNVGRIFLGALMYAGALIAGGGLLILAAIVFALVVCIVGAGRGC